MRMHIAKMVETDPSSGLFNSNERSYAPDRCLPDYRSNVMPIRTFQTSSDVRCSVAMG